MPSVAIYCFVVVDFTGWNGGDERERRADFILSVSPLSRALSIRWSPAVGERRRSEPERANARRFE